MERTISKHMEPPKIAVSFANIFTAKIETTLIPSETKQKEWRGYIDDIFSLWDSDKIDLDHFIEQANKFHPTSNSRPKYQRTRLLSSIIIAVKRERFINKSILDSLQTYWNLSIYTFQILPSTRCEKWFQ